MGKKTLHFPKIKTLHVSFVGIGGGYPQSFYLEGGYSAPNSIFIRIMDKTDVTWKIKPSIESSSLVRWFWILLLSIVAPVLSPWNLKFTFEISKIKLIQNIKKYFNSRISRSLILNITLDWRFDPEFSFQNENFTHERGRN